MPDTQVQLPEPLWRFDIPAGFPGAGQPAAGWLVYIYKAGTTDKATTYTAADGLTENTNPIVLDADGQCRVWVPPALPIEVDAVPPGPPGPTGPTGPTGPGGGATGPTGPTGPTGAGSAALWWYGNGEDGAAVLDGVNTFAWATLSGGDTYTMTRGALLTDLTVNNAITLKPDGFPIFCTGTLTLDGVISRNGLDAVTGDPNTPNMANGVFGGASGEIGGQPGTNSGDSLGGAGGAGGANGSGAGQAGGLAVLPATLAGGLSVIGFLPCMLTGRILNTGTSAGPIIQGGAGGGCGHGTVADPFSLSLGGQGGGVLGIFAFLTDGTGSVTANGGRGSDSGSPFPGTGGGGGGGGGVIIIFSSNRDWFSNWTLTVDGGLGGLPSAGSTTPPDMPGDPGSPGRIIG